MSKKKQAGKPETPAVEKPPIDLSDDQLDEARGGLTTPGVQVLSPTPAGEAPVPGIGRCVDGDPDRPLALGVTRGAKH